MSELRSELWEKEMKLTDIRLEALNSAHQLEQLRETMHNMQVSQQPGCSQYQGAHSPCHCAASQSAAGIQLLTLCPTLFCPSWR